MSGAREYAVENRIDGADFGLRTGADKGNNSRYAKGARYRFNLYIDGRLRDDIKLVAHLSGRPNMSAWMRWALRRAVAVAKQRLNEKLASQGVMSAADVERFNRLMVDEVRQLDAQEQIPDLDVRHPEV